MWVTGPVIGGFDYIKLECMRMSAVLWVAIVVLPKASIDIALHTCTQITYLYRFAYNDLHFYI